MCGICGAINPVGIAREDIERMNAAQAHRGPDGEGVVLFDGCGLGHRRLSIIDLDGGRQPMANETGSLWITFNGEIYNFQELRRDLAMRHQFSTRSDTEVILHLYEEYGEECLQRLRGMYAFAIYEPMKNRLFLGRDHLGQKPLYYYHDGKVFAFSSEIKALLAYKPELRELDREALYEYLTLRIITPPRSMFKRIRKLPPGHFLTYDQGRISITRYWYLRYEPKLKDDFPVILGELEQRLLSTVKVHLVSDVPVGAFLSGGMDSSLIVALMSKNAGTGIKTFAGDVPYQGYGEGIFARMVATAYGTEHHSRTIRPSLIRRLPDIVFHQDEPSDALSICMDAIAELARGEVKVVLGGDGGDELFGGYDRYYGNVLVSYYARLPAPLRRKVIGGILKLLPEGYWYRSLSHQLRWLQQMSFYEEGERYAKSLGYAYFSDGYRTNLYTDAFRREVRFFDPGETIREYFGSDHASDAIDRMLYADSMLRMPDHPIFILDRMSMAHGLEARAPFLDHELAEFCARIPSRYKVRKTQLRFIEGELAKKYLPAPVLSRKKQGFSSPLPYLLAGEFRRLYSTFLEKSSLVRDEIFNRDAIENILREHLRGHRDHGNRLWLLCNAEIWYRMHIEQIDRASIQRDFWAGPPFLGRSQEREAAGHRAGAPD